MLRMISEPIKKTAESILRECPGLDAQDKIILVKDGSEYLRHVQTNIKLKKDPLADLTDTAKRVLLAYIVYIRQNITTEQGDAPNEEDSANILHGELYNSKKDKKELDEELEKQLSKLGICI
jgi:hypothetical protein